jgi:hypothetical protein
MIEDYHGERKMALNENDSQAMSSSRFTVIKKTTLRNRIYILCFSINHGEYCH